MLHFVFWVNIVEVCYYCCVYLGFRCHPLRHSRSVVIFSVLTLPCRTNDVSMRLDIAPLLKTYFGPRSQGYIRGVNSPVGRNRSPYPYCRIYIVTYISQTHKRRNEKLNQLLWLHRAHELCEPSVRVLGLNQNDHDEHCHGEVEEDVKQ